jgi:hypothetical protein
VREHAWERSWCRGMRSRCLRWQLIPPRPKPGRAWPGRRSGQPRAVRPVPFGAGVRAAGSSRTRPWSTWPVRRSAVPVRAGSFLARSFRPRRPRGACPQVRAVLTNRRRLRTAESSGIKKANAEAQSAGELDLTSLRPYPPPATSRRSDRIHRPTPAGDRPTPPAIGPYTACIQAVYGPIAGGMGGSRRGGAGSVVGGGGEEEAG